MSELLERGAEGRDGTRLVPVPEPIYMISKQSISLYNTCIVLCSAGLMNVSSSSNTTAQRHSIRSGSVSKAELSAAVK